ncbi:acid phosphatase type 7-like isoform X2 [Tubulanus polymorphus]|uniref:acid phosphatase type 7-like isoform X2 n=1 Tax=Tubulanus polymorphus TaxID=672921 RepID=UPI003DA42A64
METMTTRRMNFLHIILTMCMLCRFVFAENIPEQFHISYGDDSSKMVVMWTTKKSSADGVLKYGRNLLNLDSETKYTNTHFEQHNTRGTQYYHRAKLLNLLEGRRYFYKVVDGNMTSQINSFNTLKNSDKEWVPKIMIYGDLGTYSPYMQSLVKLTETDEFSTVIHNGDLAFNLHTDGGKRGDEFMNTIQPVAASVPYMTSPGDHEHFEDYVHYRMRFSMPDTDWPMPVEKLWYSFDVGLIHFISYSTEVYFDRHHRHNIQLQKTWLIHDLERANVSRVERPWIVAFGHRPMYCSNTDYPDCEKRDTILRAGLEDIFDKYGVDLVVQAHEHSYERTWPLYRGHVYERSYVAPKAPVHVINGAAGNNEGLDTFKTKIAPWSAYQLGDDAYGSYGIMRAHNDSHLQWVQKSFSTNVTLDEFWIVQYQHGPFPKRLIPWFDTFGLELQTYIVVIAVCTIIVMSLGVCLLTKSCYRRGGTVPVETERNTYEPLIAEGKF